MELNSPITICWLHSGQNCDELLNWTSSGRSDACTDALVFGSVVAHTNSARILQIKRNPKGQVGDLDRAAQGSRTYF